MDWTGCKWVESVTERLSGTPVLCNTRMPADSVIENFDHGMSVHEISADFGLDETALRGVLCFAGRLSRADAA